MTENGNYAVGDVKAPLTGAGGAPPSGGVDAPAPAAAAAPGAAGEAGGAIRVLAGVIMNE